MELRVLFDCYFPDAPLELQRAVSAILAKNGVSRLEQIRGCNGALLKGYDRLPQKAREFLDGALEQFVAGSMAPLSPAPLDPDGTGGSLARLAFASPPIRRMCGSLGAIARAEPPQRALAEAAGDHSIRRWRAFSLRNRHTCDLSGKRFSQHPVPFSWRASPLSRSGAARSSLPCLPGTPPSDRSLAEELEGLFSPDRVAPERQDDASSDGCTSEPADVAEAPGAAPALTRFAAELGQLGYAGKHSGPAMCAATAASFVIQAMPATSPRFWRARASNAPPTWHMWMLPTCASLPTWVRRISAPCASCACV